MLYKSHWYPVLQNIEFCEKKSKVMCWGIFAERTLGMQSWTETYFFWVFYGYWQGLQYFSPRTLSCFTQFSTKNMSICQKDYLSNELCVQKVNWKWSIQVIVMRNIGIVVKQNIPVFCPEVTWSFFYIG